MTENDFQSENQSENQSESESIESLESSRRYQLLATIAALSLASILYRLLILNRLEQSAALFVGVPTLLAVVLTLSPAARTTRGMALRVTTLGLLMSGILFGEGFVCILMSAPIFYAVVLLVHGLMERVRGDVREGGATMRSLVLLPMIPVLVEGVVPEWSFDREETVSVERFVAASPNAVEAVLEDVPSFDADLPAFLRLGFPRPLETAGRGLEIGDRRSILMGGGEGEPGFLVAEVAERRPGFVRMAIVSDSSHIAHWLAWRDSTIEWRAAPGGSQVRWTLRYRRDLDPAWYFGPMQRYAVQLAAGHLIDQLATPRDSTR